MQAWACITGDGRELVVSDETAMTIRAEDGRSVSSVDISPFIDNLPFGKQTKGTPIPATFSIDIWFSTPQKE